MIHTTHAPILMRQTGKIIDNELTKQLRYESGKFSKCKIKQCHFLTVQKFNKTIETVVFLCHTNIEGRDGALVEAITLNRRVVGSTPALAVT